MSDKTRTMPQIDESAIAEQAARWQLALNTAGKEQLAEFTAWLKMSPRHGHHFLHATAMDRLLGQIDPDRSRLDPQAWIAEARQNVVSLHGPAGAPTDAAGNRTRRRPLAMAAGLAAALLATGTFIALRGLGWQEWVTRTGEQRKVELEDGSTMYLNTVTRVQAHMSADGRDIRLLSGEALFQVHRDSRRPFRVHTPGGVIQAVGTQFNVYRREDATRVYVLEGAVRITAEKSGLLALSQPTGTAEQLAAGEEARIKPDGKLSHRAAADPAQATAWRQRRLVFRADTLSDLTAEFNRYNQAPKFRLDGVDAQARHYTGTFDADDPRSFATVLSMENFYSVESTGQEIVIRARAR